MASGSPQRAARFTDQLRSEHREIERYLDPLVDQLCQTVPDLARMASSHRVLWQFTAVHLEREEDFYSSIREEFPSLVRKMLDQHGHIREAEEAFRALLAGVSEQEGSPDPRDLKRCGRLFHALLQHHILEEERDLFPLAERCLS